MRLLLLFLSMPLNALTLNQAYQSALTNEQVKQKLSQNVQAQLLKDQVVGGILPSVHLKANYLRQDANTNRTLKQDQRNINLELIQPLFQGFREFAALRQANLNLQYSEANLESFKLELYADVATAFFNLAQVEEDLTHTQELYKISKERFDFLNSRVKIGKSRKSESISAESQLMIVKAQLNALESARVSAQANLMVLTGLQKIENIKFGLDTKSIKLKELEYYQQKLTSNPTLLAATKKVQLSDEAIKIAKGAHYPFIDLRANYFIERESTNTSGSDWDLSLNFSLPLYEGGTTNAQISQDVENKYQAQLEEQLKIRTLEAQLFSTHQRLRLGVSQLRDFEKAVEFSRQSYQSLKNEYSLGLVSNLDVIQSLNQYVQSQKELAQIKIAIYQNEILLNMLVGEIN